MKKKKKTNNPYPRSFAGRLTWRIMLTLLVVMGFTSYLIYAASSSSMEEVTVQYCQEMLNSRCGKIQRALSDIYVASVNTVPDIENNIGKPDKQFDIVKRLLELNPTIRSCGISFVENYYPQKGRWFCPYAFRDTSGVITTTTIGSAQFDYLSAQWFLEAKDAKEGYWSKPFYDGTDSVTMLTSFLVPIRNEQGATVAVLGVDLSLERLNAKLQKGAQAAVLGSTKDDDDDDEDDLDKHYNNLAYFFVIDQDGTYIAHPDSDKVLKKNLFDYAKQTPDTLDDHIGRSMVAGEEGYVYEDGDGKELIINDKASYVFYRPINHINWSMGVVIRSWIVRLFGYVLGGLLLLLIVLALLVIFFVGRFAIKRAVKPVSQLAYSANEVAHGRFDTPLPIMKRRDELCQLRDSFEQMQLSLTKYVEELKTTTAQKSAIESELKIAHDIQMSMLPKIYPPFPERNDVDIYGTLTPAKGVGGDLFDFFLRDEKLFFCIGDVSGKGIPAALVMAVTRSLFRNISSYATSPEKIVFALNNALADGNETNMFVTVFVGVLDLATGHLNYCNGGHESPLLIGRDVGTLPCDPNLAIGILKDYKFTLQEADIDPQTTIFLYTDGLNEAENAWHRQFGEQRIRDVATNVLAKGEQQPLNIIYEMDQAVHKFVAGAEQSDDLTMLAIQYIGGGETCVIPN